uniref:Erythrocyte membrane protein pfemp3 n=1 Tax=Strongyloides papillosus TaxID=174720 RepID=A0A0N5BFE2_STREA
MLFNILEESPKDKTKNNNDIKNKKVFENVMKKGKRKDINSNTFSPAFFKSLYFKSKNMKSTKNNLEKKYYKQNIASFFNDIAKIKGEIFDLGKTLIKPSKKEKYMRNLTPTNKKSLKHINSFTKSVFSHNYNFKPVDNSYKHSFSEKKYNTYPTVLKVSKSSINNRENHRKNIYQKNIGKITNEKQKLSTIDVMNNNFKNKVMFTEYPNKVKMKKMTSSSSSHCVTFDEIVKLIIYNINDNNDYTIIHEPLKNDDYDTMSNEDSIAFYSYKPSDIKCGTKSNVSLLDFIILDDLIDSMTITDINNNNNSNF